MLKRADFSENIFLIGLIAVRRNIYNDGDTILVGDCIGQTLDISNVLDDVSKMDDLLGDMRGKM